MRSIPFFLLLFLPLLMPAQQTQVYVAPDAAFRKALDLYQKQKYTEAEQEFDLIVNSAKNKNDLYVVDAQYYAALCAMELFHKDAEIRLKAFLDDHPESPKCARVRFQLGRYNYRKKKYEDALAWFRQVEIYDLQKEELAEFYFKRGYSQYELGHPDSAKTDFYEIKELDSKYAAPANYYYSHISYTQGNYETALQGFLKLSNDETFGPVVPYYIAQIYFLQKRYNEVISYAPPLLDSAKRAPEIAQLIGASYYRTNHFKEAIPFLEKHRAGSRTYTRDDAYELGYAYYKSDSAAPAIQYFQDAIADSSDGLAQNAWYHLADCYIKTGNKTAARNAFGKASAIKIDPVIREDALFSFARLSYELDMNPYNEAIIALNQYLYEFPNTARRDEAYTLLTNVYLSTNHFKEALESMEKMKVMSPLMQPTYQKVAYNYGIILYQNHDYDGAIAAFNKVQTYPISRELNANAHYWKAESWYAKASPMPASKDTAFYGKAIAEYRAFLYTPGATILPNYNTANYNIGYCYFQQGQALKGISNELPPAAKAAYTNAMVSFRKYIANKTEADNNDRIFDAYLRMGDGYFRLHDFVNSSDFYAKAIETPTTGTTDKDYAMFQQAMALGYQGKSAEKAALLKKMRETYPKSNIMLASRYQEARTLHDMREYDRALESYKAVYEQDTKGDYALSCLKNMGLIYRAKNDPDNALVQYKKAVDLTQAAKGSDFTDLMHEIKEIYVAKGQLDAWETYAESKGYSESQAVADSTSWAVASKFYKDGNCASALAQCNKYIQKYPSGIYITDVHYMRAECAYKDNDLNTALASYVAILDKGKTRYNERCLVQASLIYYTQKDYANAAVMYGRLERESSNNDLKNNARVNLMSIWMTLGNNDSAAVYAAKVITIPKIPNEIAGKANYLLGKSELANGDRVNAEKHFKNTETMLPNTEYAAEARYSLCQIRYDNKDYKKAEKELLKEINDYAGYSYWSGKGWLLLADDYLALKDTFQAKYVLQSYITNGDVPELQQQAREKLAAIDAARNAGRMRKEEDLIVPPPGNGTQPVDMDNEQQGGGQQ